MRLSFTGAFDRWRQTEPVLAGFTSFPHLLSQQHGAVSREDRHEIVNALVRRRSDNSHACATAILLVLWPGLDAVRGRLRRYYAGRDADLTSELMWRTVQQLQRIDLSKVHSVAATILMNVERDIRRRLQKEWKRASVWEKLTEESGRSDERVCHARQRVLIERDIRAILGVDADLVIAIVLEEEGQAEVGTRLGLGYEAVRKRYQRALSRLRDGYAEGLSQNGTWPGFSSSTSIGVARRRKA